MARQQIGVEAVCDVTQFNNGVRIVMSGLLNMERGVDRLAGGVARSADLISIGLGGALGAGAVRMIELMIGALGRLANEALEVTSFFERLSFTIQGLGAIEKIDAGLFDNMNDALNASTQEAHGYLIALQNIAVWSPFTATEVGNAFRLLTAYGFIREEALSITESLVDWASMFNLGNDVLGRVSLALGQIASQGRLLGTEARQLAEAGIPILKILSEYTGKTTRDLQKLQKEGQLASSLVFDALFEFFGKFEGAGERVSRTVTGIISTLREAREIALSTALTSILEPMLPLADQLAKVLTSAEFRAGLTLLSQFAGTQVANGIVFLQNAFSGLINTMSNLSPATINAGLAFGLVTASIVALAAAAGAVYIAINLLVNPFTLVTAAIGAFAAAYVSNFAGIGDATNWFLNNINAKFAEFGDGLAWVTNSFSQMAVNIVTIMADLAQAAVGWGTGIVNAIASGIIGAVSAVIQAISYLGSVLSFWLAPGSPPRFLPLIDVWGQETAEVYLQGWTQADFSILEQVGQEINSILSDLISDGQLPSIDLDQLVRGSFHAFALAVDELRLLGEISEDAMQRIRDAAGPAADALVALAESYARVFAAGNFRAEALEYTAELLERVTATFEAADFSALGQFSSSINGLIGQLATIGEIDSVDAPGLIIGSQDVIATIISDLREFGQVNNAIFDDIENATVADRLREFAAVYQNVVAATEATTIAQDRFNNAQLAAAAAQQQINQTMREYDALLRPLRQQLNQARSDSAYAEEAREVAQLQRIIANESSSAAQKESAFRRIQEIHAQRQIRNLELERDAATASSEAALDAASTEQDLAQQQLSAAQEFQSLQEEQLAFLNNRINLEAQTLGLFNDQIAAYRAQQQAIEDLFNAQANTITSLQEAYANAIDNISNAVERGLKKGLSPLETALRLIQLQQDELNSVLTIAKARHTLNSKDSTEFERQNAELTIQEEMLKRIAREQEFSELGGDIAVLQRIRDTTVAIEDLGSAVKKAGGGAGGAGGAGPLDGLLADLIELPKHNPTEALAEWADAMTRVEAQFDAIGADIKLTMDELNAALPGFLKFRVESGELAPVLRSLGSAFTFMTTSFLTSKVASSLRSLVGVFTGVVSKTNILTTAISVFAAAWVGNWFDIQGKTATAIAAIRGVIDRFQVGFGSKGPLFMRIADGIREALLSIIPDNLESSFSWLFTFINKVGTAFQIFAYSLQTNGDDIWKSIDALDQALRVFIPDDIEAKILKFHLGVVGVINRLKELGEGASAAARTFGDNIRLMFASIPDIIDRSIDAIDRFLLSWGINLSEIGRMAGEFGSKIANAFRELISGRMWQNIVDVATPWLQRLGGLWDDVMAQNLNADEVRQFLQDLGGVLGTGITTIAADIKESIVQFWIPAFTTWVDLVVPKLVTKYNQMSSSVQTWVTETAANIKSKFVEEWVPAFTEWWSSVSTKVSENIISWVAGIAGLITIAASGFSVLFNELFVPAFTDWATGVATGAAEKLAEWKTAISNWIVETAPIIATELGVIATAVTTWITETAATLRAGFLAWWKPAFSEWLTDTTALLTALGGWRLVIVGWILEKAAEWATSFEGWKTGFLEWVQTVIDNTPAKLDTWKTAITGWITEAAATIKDQFIVISDAVIAWITESATPLTTSFTENWVPAFLEWVPSVEEIRTKLSLWLFEIAKWLEEADDALSIILLDWTITFVEWLGPVTLDTLTKLGEWMGAMIEWFIGTGLPLLVGGIVVLAAGLVGWIADAAVATAKALAKWAKGIYNWVLVTGVPMINNAVKAFVPAFVSWFFGGPKSADAEVNSKLAELMLSIGNFFITYFLPGMKNLGISIIGGFVAGVSEAIAKVSVVTEVDDYIFKYSSLAWKWIDAGITLGESIVSGITTPFAAAGKLVQAAVTALIDVITSEEYTATEILGRVLTIGQAIIGGIISGMWMGILTIAEDIQGIVDSFILTFKDKLGIETYSSVFALDVGIAIAKGIIQGIHDHIITDAQTAANYILGIATKVLEEANLLPWFNAGVDLAKKIIEGIGHDLVAGAAAVILAMVDLRNAIFSLEVIKGWVDEAKGLGADIIGGIVDGFTETRDTAVNAIRDVVRRLLGGGRAEAEAESPSKLFARELGVPIAEGIMDGIKGGATEEETGNIFSAMFNGIIGTLIGIRTSANDEAGGISADTLGKFTAMQIGAVAITALMSLLTVGIYQVMRSLIDAEVLALRTSVEREFGTLRDNATTTTTQMQNALETLYSTLSANLESAVESLRTTLVGIWNLLSSNLSTITGTMASSILTIVGNFNFNVKLAFDAIKEGIVQRVEDAKLGAITQVEQMAFGILRELNELAASIDSEQMNLTWYNAGYNLGLSLAAGVHKAIRDKIDAIATAAAQMAAEAIDAAKDAADAASPSKRMMREVGIPLADGILVPLEDNARASGNLAADLVEMALRNARIALLRSSDLTFTAFDPVLASVNAVTLGIVRLREEMGKLPTDLGFGFSLANLPNFRSLSVQAPVASEVVASRMGSNQSHIYYGPTRTINNNYNLGVYTSQSPAVVERSFAVMEILS